MTIKERYYERPASNGALYVVAMLCLAYGTFIAIRYASQALMDIHSFRQTQTALTTFWMMKDGFHFAYETPVAGRPWSIPFEFPIYQWIVALIAGTTGWSLSAVGRVTSFVFLVLCLYPVRTIVRLLKLDAAVFPIFTALLFSSPLYLYWGRTFMIETACVFFAVAAIRYFVEILQGTDSIRHRVLFVVLMTLSVLQKGTTALPVLAVLGLLYLAVNMQELVRFEGPVSARNSAVLKKIALATLYVGIPFVIGVVWLVYSDRLRAANPLGAYLPSGSSAWNWGTLSQRVSSKLYLGVLWKRIILQNMAGVLGLVVLVAFFASRVPRDVKRIVVISLALVCVPVFLFTNLHIVHTYYQTANVIFAIFALAVCFAYLKGVWGLRQWQATVLLVALVSSNYWQFRDKYYRVTKEAFTVSTSRDIAVGDVLKKGIPEGKGFVAFGNDWSSSIGFFAERKSFTVPAFLKDYEEKSKNPENYMSASELGGVALCPRASQPRLSDMMRWVSTKDGWNVGQVHGCYVALPGDRSVASVSSSDATESQCQGAIDSAALLPGEGDLMVIDGWILAKDPSASDKVLIYLEQAGAALIYLEPLRVPRVGVDETLTSPLQTYSGFSRVIDTASLHGRYTVGVARANSSGLERCGFHKEVSFP